MIYGPERRIQAQGCLMECCAPPFTCISRLCTDDAHQIHLHSLMFKCRWIKCTSFTCISCLCTDDAYLIHLHWWCSYSGESVHTYFTCIEHPVHTVFTSVNNGDPQSQIFADGLLQDTWHMFEDKACVKLWQNFNFCSHTFLTLHCLFVFLLQNLQLIYIWVASKCASLHHAPTP